MALGFICSSGLSSLNNGVDLTAGFLSESITLCSPHDVAQRMKSRFKIRARRQRSTIASAQAHAALNLRCHSRQNE